MKRISIYLIVGLITFLVACDNYLDVKPMGKVIPETTKDYSTIIQENLLNIEIGYDQAIFGDLQAQSELELFSDNLDASLKESGFVNYIGNRINTQQSSFYPAYYSVIKDCNIVTENMEDRDSEMARKLLATAYAMKGICYYNLFIRYSEPYNPAEATEKLGLSLVNKFDVASVVPRSNQKETAEYIASVLKEAANYNLEDKNYILTKDVAEAFLARLYFWIQDWDNAILYANKLLAKYPVIGINEYPDMFSSRFIKTPNMIVRNVRTDNMLTNEDWLTSLNMTKTRPASRELVQTFSEGNNDIRYALSFGKEGNRIRINQKMMPTNIRGEEMCLILAESYANKGETSNALKFLNMLRKERITTHVDYTEATLPDVYPQLITQDATGKALTKLMSAILCERRKELYMEGSRWFELKRNGRPEFWIASDGKKYTTTKHLYTFPINKLDVDAFSGIIIQNEGYVY